MAKHPHKLILMNGRTWRCTLDGCSYFVHLGLAHILPGKQATCNECEEIFRLDEYALKEIMPRCGACREGLRKIEDRSRLQKALTKLGVENVSELNDAQRNMLEALGLLQRTSIQEEVTEDKPESEYVASTDTPITTVETEKPRRTPEQQKAYDKIMRELGLR